MFIIKILSYLALFGSAAWFIYDPDFEPAIAIITSLSTLIGIWITSKREQARDGQTQIVGDNAVGIQAGGNVDVGDINLKKVSGDVQ